MAGEYEPPAPPLQVPHYQRPAGDGGLSTSLLLEALNRLGVIEKQNARQEVQNETILAGQAAADKSRGDIHRRINELSVNAARTDAAVETLNDWREVLDPIVVSLKDGSIEQRAVRKFISAVVKNSYARAGGAVIAGGAAWHQWETLRDGVLRLVRFKIGGP